MAFVGAGLAWLVLAAARVTIAVVPFSVVRRMLGSPSPSPSTSAATPTTPLRADARETRRAARIARAVSRAQRRSPWRSDCYPQALAARALLLAARVPHTVSFGLRRDDHGQLVAHAWVRAGGVAVSGGDGSAYVEVGTFAWPTHHPDHPGRPGRAA